TPDGSGSTDNYLLRQSTSDLDSSSEEDENSQIPSTSIIFQNSYEQLNRNKSNYSYLKIEQPNLDDYYTRNSNLKHSDADKNDDTDRQSKCLKRTRSVSFNESASKIQKKTSKFSIETLIGKDDMTEKDSTINNDVVTKIPKALENLPIPSMDKSCSSSSSSSSISPSYSISRNYPYGLPSIRSSTTACHYNPYTAVMAAAAGNYSILNGLALTSPTLYNAITTVNDVLYDSNYAKL
ncbi:unnamed protein product, partial [Didymodactylos carnosus]